MSQMLFYAEVQLNIVSFFLILHIRPWISTSKLHLS